MWRGTSTASHEHTPCRCCLMACCVWQQNRKCFLVATDWDSRVGGSIHSHLRLRVPLAVWSSAHRLLPAAPYVAWHQPAAAPFLPGTGRGSEPSFKGSLSLASLRQLVFLVRFWAIRTVYILCIFSLQDFQAAEEKGLWSFQVRASLCYLFIQWRLYS